MAFREISAGPPKSPSPTARDLRTSTMLPVALSVPRVWLSGSSGIPQINESLADVSLLSVRITPRSITFSRLTILPGPTKRRHSSSACLKGPNDALLYSLWFQIKSFLPIAGVFQALRARARNLDRETHSIVVQVCHGSAAVLPLLRQVDSLPWWRPNDANRQCCGCDYRRPVSSGRPVSCRTQATKVACGAVGTASTTSSRGTIGTAVRSF